jgi:hypothetical protein
VVTVSLEVGGPEVSRPYIEAARPEHPSLLDSRHQMDALFGVVNIPNVVWIDEAGLIVRPAEPGWPGPQALPEGLLTGRPRLAKPRHVPEGRRGATRALLSSGQDREGYPDVIRDWVAHGAVSRYALSPSEVVARSQPRSMAKSEAAAHFELAVHLWTAGRRESAIAHFNECHRLQPDNWTYKRQAWSLVGNERVGGDFGRFVQGPLEGEEDEWPFVSDFGSDVAALDEGEYYPSTL